MIVATPPRQPRSTVPRLVLAAICVAALVALTQCKMTADKVTGVDMGAAVSDGQKIKPQNKGNCISDCAHEANDERQAENDLNKDNIKACNGDPTCLANEEARHEAALDAIEAQRRRCMDNCHHQGGGDAR
jgi:hypothetical protein